MVSICLICAALAFPAQGAGLADSIVSQLRAQGFTSVDVSTTLLGRVRILAEGAASRREIVLNPRTGEILRDYEESLTDGAQIGHLLGRPAAAAPARAPATGVQSPAEVKGEKPEQPEKPEDNQQESHDSEDSSDNGGEDGGD